MKKGFFIDIVTNSKAELKMANNRIISFDVLRIIAAFAVVMLHVTSQRLDTSFLSNEWEIRNVYDSFVRWCVPVFFMISGALFLDHGRKIDVGRLYKKNILHLIFIFFAWSFIYALYSATVRCYYNISHIILRILEGPVHFWFLKILIGKKFMKNNIRIKVLITTQ